MDSLPEKYDEFSETRKDLYTILSRSIKQACIRPRCWLSKGQILDVLDDISNHRMAYEIIYLTEERLPFRARDITHELIDRLVAKYKYNHMMRIDGEMSGNLVSLRGHWKHIDEVVKEAAQAGGNIKQPRFDRDHRKGLNYHFRWSANERPTCDDSEVSA